MRFDVAGDNYKAHVIGYERHVFEMGMSLMMNGMSAKHYAETERWGLVLFWYVSDQEGMRTEHTYYDWKDEGATYIEHYQIKKLDEPMYVGDAIPFAHHWLQAQDFGTPDDIDGSYTRGFEISTGETWFAGHVGDHTGALGFIRPQWIYHSK